MKSEIVRKNSPLIHWLVATLGLLPLPLMALLLAARCWRGSFLSASAIARLHKPLIADNSNAARDFGYAPVAFIAHDVLSH